MNRVRKRAGHTAYIPTSQAKTQPSPTTLSKHFLLTENAIGYLDLLSRNELWILLQWLEEIKADFWSDFKS